ncbi:hypothetical protein AB6C85_01845 [Vibrio splendidus]
MWYEWAILGLLYVIALAIKAWLLCGLALAQDDKLFDVFHSNNGKNYDLHSLQRKTRRKQ